jgi:hypothetical protein
MFRRAIQLLIVALVAHALYRVVPPFVAFYRMRDAAMETATHADTPSFTGHRLKPEEIRTRLAKTAAELGLPLEGEDFQITTANKVTVIDASYVVRLEYFPRQYYAREFVIHAEGGASRYRPMTP